MNSVAKTITCYLVVAFSFYLLSCLFLLCLPLLMLNLPDDVGVKDFRWVWICSIPIGLITAYFPFYLNGLPRWRWIVSLSLILLWDVCIVGMFVIYN